MLFTANPLTGKRRQAVIDASPGLGEAVVSGAVNPDHFVVDTATGEILERRLGDKRVAVRATAGGGTRRVELAGRATSLASPTSRSARSRSSERGSRPTTGRRKTRSGPSIADGGVWLSQARPITTLFPLPAGAPTDGRRPARLLLVQRRPGRLPAVDADGLAGVPAAGVGDGHACSAIRRATGTPVRPSSPRRPGGIFVDITPAVAQPGSGAGSCDVAIAQHGGAHRPAPPAPRRPTLGSRPWRLAAGGPSCAPSDGARPGTHPAPRRPGARAPGGRREPGRPRIAAEFRAAGDVPRDAGAAAAARRGRTPAAQLPATLRTQRFPRSLSPAWPPTPSPASCWATSRPTTSGGWCCAACRTTRPPRWTWRSGRSPSGCAPTRRRSAAAARDAAGAAGAATTAAARCRRRSRRAWRDFLRALRPSRRGRDRPRPAALVRGPDAHPRRAGELPAPRRPGAGARRPVPRGRRGRPRRWSPSSPVAPRRKGRLRGALVGFLLRPGPRPGRPAGAAQVLHRPALRAGPGAAAGRSARSWRRAGRLERAEDIFFVTLPEARGGLAGHGSPSARPRAPRPATSAS